MQPVKFPLKGLLYRLYPIQTTLLRPPGHCPPGSPALRCRSAGGREGLRQRGATSGTSENAMVPQGIGCDWRMFMDFRGAFLLATISLIETQKGVDITQGCLYERGVEG